MNGCEEFRRALGRARDGEAAPDEAAAARAHAAGCTDCARDCPGDARAGTVISWASEPAHPRRSP